jgi:hypothetical protein
MCLPAALLKPTVGQEADDAVSTAVTAAPSGVQRFANDRWASLAVVGVNPTDQDVDETVSVYLNNDPKLQFSTKFWIPSGGKRQTWLPIRIPSADEVNGDRVNLSVMRVVESDGHETFDDNRNGMPLWERSLLLTNREINSGLFAEIADLENDGNDEGRLYDLNHVINAGRDSVIQSSLELPPINFSSNFLPPTHHALDELDQLVIAGDHLRFDTGGLIAVRRWLHSGGRAWIMLDLVSDAMVMELLGDDAEVTVVNRVELNDFEIEITDAVVGHETLAAMPWSSERPVEMTRVFAGDAEVVARVDGWPAAFWRRIGGGEVLFTTLGARGWLDQDGTAGTALHEISRRLFEPRNEPPEFRSALTPIVDDQIGYQIPSRRFAATVLGLNALVILVAGCWWARRRQLERMAVLVPVSAVVSTAVMLWVGARNAQSVPSTVATGQVVRIRSATDEAEITTVQAVYSQQAVDPGLVTRNGTMTMPVAGESASSIRRVRLDDDGRSRWLGTEHPPGVVRHLDSDSTLQLTRPIGVRGTFDTGGFIATLFGIDPVQCEDAILVNEPAPVTGVRLPGPSDSSGQIRADVADLLAADQFVPGSLLTDDQRIRQDFLRRTLQASDDNSFGSSLSLLCWTAPFDLGVRFADSFRQTGSALVSIPVQIDRPEEGIDFRIPATFVRTEAFIGERGLSSLYNARTGRWLSGLTKPTETELLFRFPEALDTMKLKQVNVAIKINAPSRTLIIETLVDGERVTVFEKKSPSGLIRFSIENEDALALHPDGGFWMEIGITESENAVRLRTEKPGGTISDLDETESNRRRKSIDRTVDNTTWQIDWIQVDAVGRIESGE